MKHLILTSMLLPALALAYHDGPPDGRTGAPGQQTCTACHSSFPLNSGDGLFSIDGPAAFEPGETYPITVSLQDPGQQRWGFEFTPLTHGTCSVTDQVNTQWSSTSGNQYIKHTADGTFAGLADGPASWTFNWTAPAEATGSITFYAAGNAANGNGGNSGDYIYTTSFTTEMSTGVDVAEPKDFALVDIMPNPFNPSTTIQYRLDLAGDVRLAVYDMGGRLVSRLQDTWQPAGLHAARWNGVNHLGSPVASGLYLALLEVNGQSDVRRMLLVK